MLDVPDVAAYAALHLLESLGLAAVAGDLAPAGDAGLDVVPDHVFVDQVGVFLGMLDHVGPRAHHAHLSEQHVDELRELVDAGVAQYLTPAGDACVVARGLEAVGLGIDLHAAELQAGELLAVESRALLAEEHGPRHGDLGDRGHHQEYRDEESAEEEQREHYVEGPLHDAVAGPAQGLVVEAQAGHAAHHREAHLVVDVVAYVGHAVEPHQMVLAVFDYRQYHLGLLGGQTAVEAAHLRGVFLEVADHVLGLAQILAAPGEPVVGLIVEIAADPVAYRRVVGQLVVERGVVLGASHEHRPVAPPGVGPVPLHRKPSEQAEERDHQQHGGDAERIQSPAGHREIREMQDGSGDQREPEHVVEHDLDDLRLLRLLQMQHHPAVGYAGVVHGRNQQQRLGRGGTSLSPAETERQVENQIAEHQVAHYYGEPYPCVVPAPVVIDFHIIAFSRLYGN